MEPQKINLNFLEVTPQEFSFTIYRKLYNGNELSVEYFMYSLPETIGDDEFVNYIVSFVPEEGFEEFLCKSKINTYLTLKILNNWLLERLKQIGIDVSIGEKFYDRRIDFTLIHHARGEEKISLNPYYFKEQDKLGFLVDFFFKSNPGEKLDKKILQLSLALGIDGRSNKNYYSDHYHKIQSFIQTVIRKIGYFNVDSSPITISENLISLETSTLAKKVFRFKNEQTDLNQFNGVRKFGAFQEISEKVKYVFIFEDKFKSFANNLFFSLIGKTNPGTFSGLKQFFNLTFGNDLVHRIALKNYSPEEVKKVSEEVIEYRNANHDYKIIAIFLEPNRFEEIPSSMSPYYLFKFYLTKENIPVQVVRDDITNNANALKWSTSNIALQIFSKLGGIPWKLKPSHNECLILGIGSSLERREDGSIKKYFAYSVCLDSAGIYKKLDVLSEESTKEQFLLKLSTNLIDLFSTPEFKKYKKCALHISESVTKEAISTIQKSLLKINDVEFKVLKINVRNQFFGYSNHNTYVPYESSFIKLAHNEYLIWFDGLIQGKENVYQKVGNPIHIKFLNSPASNNSNNDIEYIQDAINLSGANWRGFNSRQTPISIYYAKIVADYTVAFSNFEDFDKSHFSNNLPWFL